MPDNDHNSEAETAARRGVTLKRMLATPKQPRKGKTKAIEDKIGTELKRPPEPKLYIVENPAPGQLSKKAAHRPHKALGKKRKVG